MKKVTATTWLKAISMLYFLLITIFTSNAQQRNWELGIGLRPMNLEDDPYSLILKQHVTPHFAWRLGVGGGYSEKSRFVEYWYSYLDPAYHFTYEYTRVDKKFYVGSFLGVQYLGFKHMDVSKQSFFDWYLLSDLTIKYHMQKTELPNGIFYNRLSLQEGDRFFIVELDNKKEMILGIRQGLGIKYTLSRNTTVNIEAGAHYEWVSAKVNKNDFHVFREWNEENNSISSTIYAVRKTRNYRWGFSPVTLISLHHRF